ncbi:MAG TPA: hypothetical protein VHE83_19555 [Mycobacteriales bacterium]|nr:hypothetical protein [Mycobacteriales bacterium]
MRSLSRAAREAWAALGVSTVIAIAMTWPSAWHPASTIPADLGDPMLESWQLGWGAHALVHQPLQAFDSNTFFPLPNSLAFSDSLLGDAPFSLLFGNGPTASLVRYNAFYIAAFALATWGAFLLARQLGARRPGAVVAGLAFGYAPWRLSQAGHLHIISSGGLPLTLALLARGHGYTLGGRRRPELENTRPWCAVAGWAVAAYQVSLGFGLGLAFAMVVGLVTVIAVGWWFVGGRPALPRRLLIADGAGLVLFVLVAGLVGGRYLKAVHDHPEARRTLAEVSFYSPPFRGLLITPSTDWLWGHAQDASRAKLGWAAEMTIAPGLFVTIFAFVGLVAGVWGVRRRIVLAGAVGTTALFALGTTPWGGRLTYRLLFDHVPGWQGVRTPSRLVVWTLLGLALLAATGVDRIVDELSRATARPVGVAVALVCAGLVLMEGISTTAHPKPRPEPASFKVAAASGRPVLVLPTDEISDETTMFWSTDGFPDIVNGGSGFTPTLTAQIRDVAKSFPEPDAVDALRSLGVGEVVELGGQVPAPGPLPAGVTVQTVGPDLVFTLG